MRLLRRASKRGNAGNGEKALELYRSALGVYPKNPWALYQISVDRLRFELTPQQVLDGANGPYYRLIRSLDPMFERVYQVAMSQQLPDVASSVVDTVWPSYVKLSKREDVANSMRLLADGYRETREHEFALYAYKFLLYASADSGGALDREIRGHISTCLTGISMEETDAYVAKFLNVFGW